MTPTSFSLVIEQRYDMNFGKTWAPFRIRPYMPTSCFSSVFSIPCSWAEMAVKVVKAKSNSD